jgi:hypothetical protein
MFWPVIRLLSGGTVGPVRQHISSLCIDFPPVLRPPTGARLPSPTGVVGRDVGEWAGASIFGDSRAARVRRPSVSVLASLRVQDGDDT